MEHQSHKRLAWVHDIPARGRAMTHSGNRPNVLKIREIVLGGALSSATI